MVEPSDDELENFTLAAQKLWDLDENRLTPGVDYKINVQEGKQMAQRADMAEGKLFLGVKRETWTKPTYVIFYNLLDNYEREVGTSEEYSSKERKEMSDFLSAVMDTKVMQYCHSYCVRKGRAPADKEEFKRLLYRMWFSTYRKAAANDSCGFEHVFIGECRNDKDETTGFHNWIQFYIEEGRGNLEYMGYVRPRRGRDTTDDEDRMLSVQFSWHGEVKPVSSFFVGTSPEFELSLYSLVFLCSDEEKTYVEIGPYNLNICSYRRTSGQGDQVVTVYPELISEDA